MLLEQPLNSSEQVIMSSEQLLMSTVVFSTSPYLDNHLSEGIYTWTIGTL